MANKLTTFDYLKRCAEAARDFTNGLVAQLATSVTDAVEEMDTVKADKSVSVSFVIPASGWVSDTTVADYPYRYDLSVSDITALDKATVSIAPNSMSTAIACGLCPTNETLAGKIRFWSKSVPAKDISAEYWIEQGKEN